MSARGRHARHTAAAGDEPVKVTALHVPELAGESPRRRPWTPARRRLDDLKSALWAWCVRQESELAETNARLTALAERVGTLEDRMDAREDGLAAHAGAVQDIRALGSEPFLGTQGPMREPCHQRHLYAAASNDR